MVILETVANNGLLTEERRGTDPREKQGLPSELRAKAGAGAGGHALGPLPSCH